MARIISIALFSILLILGTCDAETATDSTEGGSGSDRTTPEPDNPCLPNPCSEETLCTPKEDSYTCEDPCLSDPCANGGICTVSDHEIACKCAAGFNGSSCENPITCEGSVVILTNTTAKENSVCETNNFDETVVFFDTATAGSFSYANVTCSVVCGGDQQEWVGARKCNNDGKWSTTWRTCDAASIGNSVLDTANPKNTTAEDVDNAVQSLADVAASSEISQEEASSTVTVVNNLFLASSAEAQQAAEDNSERILNSVDDVAMKVPLTEGTDFDRYEEAESEFSLAVAGKNSISRALIQTVYYGVDGEWDPSYNLAGSPLRLSNSSLKGSYISGAFDKNGTDRISFKMYVATNQLWGLSDVSYTKVVMSVDSPSASEGFTFKFKLDSNLTATGEIFNEEETETGKKWTQLFCERWDRATNKWEEEESCEKYSAKNFYGFCTCEKSGEYIMRAREVVVYDPCSGEVCENDGNCTAEGDTAICSCALGYTGSRCETAISCLSAPCEDGEVCIPKDSTYECKDPCLDDPCKNRGKCTVTDNEVYCECAAGYTGDMCEEEIICEESAVMLTDTIVEENSVCKDNDVNDTVVFFRNATVGSFSYANVTCSVVCGGDQQESVGARKCNNDGKWSTTWRTCDAPSIGNSVLDTADPEETTAEDIDNAAQSLADVAAASEISQEEASSTVTVVNNLFLASNPEAQQAAENNSESILNSVDEVAMKVPLTNGTDFDRYQEAESEFSLAVAGKNSISRALIQTVYYGVDGEWDPSYNLAGSPLTLSGSPLKGSYINGTFDKNGTDRISFKMYVAANQLWDLSNVGYTKVVMSVDSPSTSEGFTFRFKVDFNFTATGSIFNETTTETEKKWAQLFCERWDRANNKWEKEGSCEKYSTKDSYAFCTCKKSGEYIMRTVEYAEVIENGLSPGAIAGIVVGSVVGVALIVGGVYYFCFSSKAKAKKKSAVTPLPPDHVELESHGNVAVDSNARADSSDED